MTATADPRQRALELGRRYLNQRERTEAEMRRYLDRKGMEAPLVEETVRALSDAGYLDDARFVRLFAQDKRELEQWGDERIRRGLATRGVDHQLIEETLAGEEQTSELDRALMLLRRRFPTPPVDRRERERALGILLRKGYESEVALDALRAYRTRAQQSPVR